MIQISVCTDYDKSRFNERRASFLKAIKITKTHINFFLYIVEPSGVQV